MVGIVLVSHSATLAEGVAELARQMGGAEVRVEPAGGLDLPDRPIGTDAVVVLGAIERAWSDEGVLVLMDLGSAVLSAEMALEMLPDERRERVRLTAAPFVEGAVAAAVAARLGRALNEVAGEARGGLAPKLAHLGEAGGAGAEADREQDTAAVAGETSSMRLRVTNRLGLHARPAARFVTAASRFDAEVRVRNLTNGRGPADAHSLNAVAMLGVLQDHEIEVTASGREAPEALDAIRALADANFGDGDKDGAVAAVAEAPPPATGPGDPSLLVGIPASPGVAVGPVRHLLRPDVVVSESPTGPPDEERRRLDAALAAAAAEIHATRTSVAARAGEQAAEIFDAHLLVLADQELLAPVRDAIARGEPAAPAWRDAIERMAARWRTLDTDYLRARAKDVEAVGDQVLRRLVGGGRAERPSGPGVLVANDLTPAETASLDVSIVTGVASARGAPTSHAAVLARSLGIPAVVALGVRILAVPEGTDVVLDGETGTVRVEPDERGRANAESKAAAFRASEAEARLAASEPATTLDGTRIHVLANVARPDDALAAAAAGADGVGLLRTEFLFLGRDRMPDEAEQADAYRRVADALEGRPVILRTLDVGGDKPLPYLPMPPEANPFLGVRGLRLGLERPEVLRTQLRAALRVAADRPLRVMFPMVTTLDEVRRARELVDATLADLADAGPDRVDVGIMIEVPAAALGARALAEEVDFFSIGTNDLAQYTLAAERGNERVAGLADALHPAVLRLIEMTAAAGAERGRPVGVCGELASDVTAVPILIGLGVRELSVGPPAVGRVKRAVRAVDLEKAREIAREALGLASAAEVRSLVG